MGLPEFLTVEEAAAVLRIGRTAAYELARRYRVTGGTEGLPVIVLGRLLRVPRAELEAWAGGALSAPDEPTREPSVPTRHHLLRPIADDVPTIPPISG
jgi:excisionase family DNA binding protein